MSPWRDLGALFTPNEKTKLAGIEDSAKDDQTGAEIKDLIGLKKKYELSDDIIHTGPSGGDTSATGYVFIKEVTISTLHPSPTDIRVHFAMGSTSGSVTVYGRVYKNGGAVGTPRSTTSTGAVHFNEDISFAQGDTIEIWGYTTNASYPAMFYTNYIRGHEVYKSLAEAIADSNVGLDDPFVGSN